MEKSDFDPLLLDLSYKCAHAILGGLSFGWHCVDKMKASQEHDAEWVQAQILFVVKDYFDSVTSECPCDNCDIDYPSCGNCIGA